MSILAFTAFYVLLMYGKFQSSHIVQYHEFVNWRQNLVKCSLEYWIESNSTDQWTLHSQTKTVLGGISEVRETKHIFSDSNWAQNDLAVMVRIQGIASPQLLVRQSRSNWGDYILYDPSEGDLHEVFRFSHRDSSCISWIVGKAGLKKIIVYDRWKPSKRFEPNGMRWQERREYNYDYQHKYWAVITRKWQTYRFGKPMLHSVLSKPADCNFRFNSG